MHSKSFADYQRRQEIYKNTLENNKTSKHFKKYDFNSKEPNLALRNLNLTIFFFREIEPKPPSILWRLFLMFRFEILSAAAIKILSDVMQLANPFFLKYTCFL